MITDSFYRKFEDEHRGSRELIKSRLREYLTFIAPLKKLYPSTLAVDLGCGRGEWLELMRDEGITARGVDLDSYMLQACVDLKLQTVNADAVAFLKTLPDSSQSIVSAFHLVEHIPFDTLQELISEAYRVLLPAGLLILETPNPENIKVSTTNFYLDPSHEKPIPPLLLNFLTNFHGFHRSKIVRLQEPHDLANKDKLNLNDIFDGVSPDYSIIAQKTANETTLNLFENSFNKSFGLTLEYLADKYDTSRNIALDALQYRITEVEKLNTRLAEVEKLDARLAEVEKLDTRLADVEKLNTRLAEVEKLDTRLVEVEKHDMRKHEQNFNEAIDKFNQATRDIQTQLINSETKFTALATKTAQMEVMQNSVSWRATKPLRWFSSLLPVFVRKFLRRTLKLIYWLLTPWLLSQRLKIRTAAKDKHHQLISSYEANISAEPHTAQDIAASTNIQGNGMKTQLRKIARVLSTWPVLGRFIRIGIAVIRLPEERIQLQNQLDQLNWLYQGNLNTQEKISNLQNCTINTLQEKISRQQELIDRHSTFIAQQLPRLARSLAELNQKENKKQLNI